jgi:glycosyltransferase involved in cell wall biosynthesis
MNGLSAVIITFNEERNIRRCLNSLKYIADEIIIIDSHSTDQTRSICETFNCKFYSQDWKGYSGSKNIGNSKANFSHILSLDADEELSPKLQQSILAAKEKGLAGAYSFSRLSNYCGTWIKHGDWYPDRKLRIWPKDEGKWEGEIHEKVALNPGVSVKTLKGDLHHYSYYSINEHIQQINSYSSLHAKIMFQKGKKATFTKLIFSPALNFISGFVFKGGFRDGYYGFMIAIFVALGTFLKYAKLFHLNHRSDV